VRRIRRHSRPSPAPLVLLVTLLFVADVVVWWLLLDHMPTGR
jgi:hypothetical protein